MIGQLAIVSAAMFFGAALSVGFAEHPARLTLGDGPMVRQWQPSYARGYVMQGALAVAGFLLAAITWWRWGGPLWLAGGLVLLANWPFTLFVILPVNRILERIDTEAPPPDTRPTMIRWGQLHAVRTVLGAIALALLILAARR